jgi:hypothetical protein
MTNATDLSKVGLISNAVYNSITSNATAITAISVGAANAANLTTSTNVATIGTAAYFVANGNVGIGTANPTAKLDVSGTANVSGNVVIGGNLTTTGSISGANVTTTTNVATIGTAVYFVPNGNVGIGTSSPSSKLTVTSTTTGTYEIGRFQGAANSSPYLYHMSTGGSPNFTLLSYGPQPSAVYPTLVIRGFYSNATGGDAGGYPQIEFVRSGGNTSITTATPSGSVLSRIISYGSNSTSSLPGTIIESVAEADFTTTSTTGIRFQTANTGSLAERMRIAANGNVGIGTSTPGAMLAVTGSATTLSSLLTNIAEPATISATAATGTIAYDVTTQSVLYYTSNASANWTVNFRGSSGTSLNTLLTTGQSITVAFLVTQGAVAYYNNAVQVDGTPVTPRYQGSSAWTAGNASSVDIYTYTIMKTGPAAFSVFASQTQFK